jgi:hypothetical protein
LALRDAPEDLQSDRAIVLAAVNQNPMALEFVPAKLKSLEICRLACQKNKDAAWFMDPYMLNMIHALMSMKGSQISGDHRKVAALRLALNVGLF